MSKQLQVLIKEFEQNAALKAILERRRVIAERSRYELQGREAMDEVNRNKGPWARTGTAVEATSARVAQQVAGIPPPDAANVMTGGAYSTGGSESSTRATGGSWYEYTTSTINDETLSQWRGQRIPQATLTGELAKTKGRRRSQQTKELIGKGKLSKSLITNWRAKSSG